MLETKLALADDKDSRCLMVVLHGLGDSMAGYYWLPSELDLPSMNYALVNAPDRYYQGYSWYDFTGDQDSGVKRSRAELFQLLDHLVEQGFPTEKTLLFGFSQGCLMTLDVGLRYPRRFAGLVGISGYVHEPAELIREFSPVAREQRLLVTHGHRDPLVPLETTRAQIDQLKAAGIQISWHEFDKAHSVGAPGEVDLIRQFAIRGFA